MGDVIRLEDYRRLHSIRTPFGIPGWRLAWSFQFWPWPAWVPVWVLDWPI